MPKVTVTLIRDDTAAHPWHWEAREANGHLLATTPPGEWYADKRDALQAVTTLFGDQSEVLCDLGVGGNVHRLLRLPIEKPASPDPTTETDDYPVSEVEG